VTAVADVGSLPGGDAGFLSEAVTAEVAGVAGLAGLLTGYRPLADVPELARSAKAAPVGGDEVVTPLHGAMLSNLL